MGSDLALSARKVYLERSRLGTTRRLRDPSKAEDRKSSQADPTECARLMGFDGPRGHEFSIPVSDTQAYRQFEMPSLSPVSRRSLASWPRGLAFRSRQKCSSVRGGCHSMPETLDGVRYTRVMLRIQADRCLAVVGGLSAPRSVNAVVRTQRA